MDARTGNSLARRPPAIHADRPAHIGKTPAITTKSFPAASDFATTSAGLNMVCLQADYARFELM
jgi:hypothetical protein